jgi:antitoxin VapB
MTTTAKLFQNGSSQAVRLPKEFRFEGTFVRIRRFGSGVLIEPAEQSAREWLDALNSFDEPFMPEGREQPPMPKADYFG